MYEFFLAHSMNIFLGLIGLPGFFSINFLLREYIYFLYFEPPRLSPHTLSNGPSLTKIDQKTRKIGQICVWNPMTTGFIM